MSFQTWRRRLSTIWHKLYLYPEPEPLPRTRLFWVALGLVSIAVLLFCGFFLIYLTRGQDAYLTNAEDLGIMDQAIWNTIHGQVLHQTVCNILSDTNCYDAQGLMRFAIHFEPILFPVSWLYFFWPTPKTLLVLQTLVVACGAYPAFLLARLRLRSDLAGVVIALLYLLYPAQQQATVDDFHAVTFTVSFLFFMLYFLYTRRTGWMFFFAVLAMACKEEIPLLVACCGIWSMVLQRRWKSGMALTVLASAWAVVGLMIIPHLYSPVGHTLLISRYADLGDSPVGIAKTLMLHPVTVLKAYVFDPVRLFYLRSLVAPAGFLPLLAPWVLVLASPTLLINLLSSNDQMHSGLALYQYNAEIVPILIFSTIEAMQLISQVGRWSYVRYLRVRPVSSVHSVTMGKPPVERKGARRLVLSPFVVSVGLLIILSGYTLALVYHYDALQGPMPFSKEYQWPEVTAHTKLAQQFIAKLPANASVSAQSALVPHVSHRADIYLFPYGDGVTTPAYAQYIFLDQTSDPYPYFSVDDYTQEVQKVLQSGMYGVVMQQDGYLLLKQGHA